MGLDINAYRNCKLVSDGAKGFPTGDNTAWPYVNPSFPQRADAILHHHWYKYEDKTRFCAGTYDAYGEWRTELARLAGYAKEDSWNGTITSGPFYELINFADNEGIIGAETSAKLAADFAAHEAEAQQKMEPYDFDRYQRWKQAFEIASQNGMVEFR